MKDISRQTLREARELALNLLFQVDVAKLTMTDAIQAATENARVSPKSLEIAIAKARGALEYAAKADRIVTGLSPEWPTERQPGVDRNILRLALFEIFEEKQTPPPVAMNEAVELAKTFSTEESGKFVNGVLAGALRLAQAEGKENVGNDS